MKQGPRLYNLFPLLAGTTAQWIHHLDRIKAMGFTAIYLNPVTRSGGSGSLYAVADYNELDPRFDDGSGRDGSAQLGEFLAQARARDLGVLMDLVVNHTANDATLVKTHPEWYRRDADGNIEAPYAVDTSDPENVEKRTVWGDLAELDYRDRPERAAMIAYFDAVIAQALELGFTGFRCDAAYKVPGDVWKRMIDAARARRGDVLFVAETLGSPIEDVLQLASAGFDAFFSSSKWWDFDGAWLIDQYEQLRRITPSIAFPESHDTPRLATELHIDDAHAAERMYRLWYAFSACFASGVMMPMGYEFGARTAVNVVTTRPSDMEAPWFDISAFIAQMNAVKAAQPALNEEGPQRRIDFGLGGPVALERRTGDGGSPVLTLINPTDNDMRVQRSKIAGETPAEITPQADTTRDDDVSIVVPPHALRVFAQSLHG